HRRRRAKAQGAKGLLLISSSPRHLPINAPPATAGRAMAKCGAAGKPSQDFQYRRVQIILSIEPQERHVPLDAAFLRCRADNRRRRSSDGLQGEVAIWG